MYTIAEHTKNKNKKGFQVATVFAAFESEVAASIGSNVWRINHVNAFLYSTKRETVLLLLTRADDKRTRK
jgi:hypothetical protein